MLTNNFLKCLGLKMLGDGATVKAKDVTGTERVVTFVYDTNDYFGNHGAWITSSLNTANARGVGFVYGGSEPTAEDYVSDGTLVTGIQVTPTRSNINEDDSTAVTYDYTIVNNNSYDVTIDEVCWIAAVFYASSLAYRVLADRTKLENPITIAPGGVGQITYTIRLNYPV